MESDRYNGIPIIRAESKGFFENKTRPLEIFYKNLKCIDHILELSNLSIEKVCAIGSSCMYPDKSSALVEEDLGTGAPYVNNALYSYSELLIYQLCKTISDRMGYQYFMVIPSDIFGDPNDTHYICQIMRRMHEAKQLNLEKMECYGTGASIRHPIYDMDFDDNLKQIIDIYRGTEPINLATPVSYAKKISSIIQDIKEVIGFKGDIEWDASYSDGQLVKVLNTDKLEKIFKPTFTPWMDSLERTYERLKKVL
jgi:GDP-L-fucose synthase